MNVRDIFICDPPVKTIGAVVLALLFLFPSGCAMTQSGIYRTELGRAPDRNQIIAIVQTELQSFGFRVQAQSQRSLQSDWRTQSSKQADMAGVEKVRDRAVVSINQRGRKYYLARLKIRHEALVAGAWKPVEPSSAMVDQYEKIRENIREDLRQYMTQKR